MKTKLILCLALILSGYCFAAIVSSQQKSADIPNASWEPIFFEAINQLSAKAGWKPLRETMLPSHSLEVRIWVGFGIMSLEGYSLRQDGSVWTGHHIVDNLQTNSVTVGNIEPKGGWDKLWTRLVQLDILTLPDSSTLPDEQMAIDGVCYVVEINKDGHYRTYEYGNPQDQKWPEAKKINSIGQILEDDLIKK